MIDETRRSSSQFEEHSNRCAAQFFILETPRRSSDRARGEEERRYLSGPGDVVGRFSLSDDVRQTLKVLLDRLARRFFEGSEEMENGIGEKSVQIAVHRADRHE